MTYLLVFFLLFFPLSYVAGKDTSARPFAQGLLFLLLLYFSVFRVEVGRDFNIYYWAYTEVESSYFKNFEPLWQNLILGLHSIGVDYFGFQALISTLTLLLIFRGIYRLSLHPIVAVLSFVLIYWGYFETMNAVRQYLAMALLLGFFDLFIEKRYWSFLLVMILAFSIHRSALCILPMVLMFRVSFSPVWIYVLLTISLFWGTQMVDMVAGWIYPYLPERYSFYLEKVTYTLDRTSGGYQLFLNGVTLYFAAQYLYFKRWHTPTSYYIIALFLSTLLYNSTLSIAPLSRFLHYPQVFLFLLIPNSFALYKKNHNQLFIILILFIFFLFEVRILTISNEPFSHFRTIFHHLSLY